MCVCVIYLLMGPLILYVRVYVLYNTVLIIVFFCVLCFSLNTLCILYCFTELINSQAQLAHVCVIALITGLSYQNTHSRQICCCQLAPRQIRTQRQKQRYHGPLLPKRTFSSDFFANWHQIGIPLHSIAFLQHLRFCHIDAKASSVLYMIKEGLKNIARIANAVQVTICLLVSTSVF